MNSCAFSERRRLHDKRKKEEGFCQGESRTWAGGVLNQAGREERAMPNRRKAALRRHPGRLLLNLKPQSRKKRPGNSNEHPRTEGRNRGGRAASPLSNSGGGGDLEGFLMRNELAPSGEEKVKSVT